MTRRVAVLVIVLGFVVAAVIVDRTAGEPGEVATVDNVIDASEFPVASAPSALSSTWFCAGGTADDEAFADHAVTVLNPGDQELEVTITAFGGDVAPPAVRIDPESLDDTTTTTAVTTTTEATATDASAREPVVEVVGIAPRTRARFRLGDLVQAPVVSALVEADAGGLVVEHEVTSIHGFDVKPCATAASTTWHFAWGTTEADARELLVLFNPFPDDAVVDGRFSTEDGVREPVRFDGLVVPGRGTIAVDLGDDVTRRAEVAATITARAGRVVADRIVRLDGSGSGRGLTVQTGVPAAQSAWVFPDGFSSENVREEYVVYNPGDTVAEVEVALALDRPDENGIPEPFDLSLAPGEHQVVDVAADGRVPDAVAHSATVRSLNGVPVVAERVIRSSGDSRRGLTVTTGSPVESEVWSFAAGETSASSDQWLVLVNLDPQILAEVQVTAVAGGQLVPVAELQEVELAPGSRLAVRLGERITRDDLAIVVTSTEPIVAERGLYAVGEDRRGMSNAIGVPGLEGLRPVIDPDDVALDVDLGDGDDPLTTEPDDDPVPTAPDDVELPDPDQTIVVDDPDAEAETPTSSTTTGSTSTTTTAGDGVPDTQPG